MLKLDYDALAKEQIAVEHEQDAWLTIDVDRTLLIHEELYQRWLQLEYFSQQ